MILSASSDRRGALFGALAVGCAATLFTPPASGADPPPAAVPDPAAEALFHSGRQLVERGNWDAGCPKFEASLALYLSASTLLNLARCHEHYGKLASAWATYKRALVVNRETPGEERRSALEDVAKRGLAALEPRLPKLRIVIPIAPEGLKVTRNEQYIPLAMLGTTFPVDPGEHRIVVRAPGYRTERRTVTALERKTKRVEIPLILGDGGEGEDGASAGVVSGGHVVPTWSLIVGAGGLALLTAGAIFRVDQAMVEGFQEGKCDGDVLTKCPPGYMPAEDNARKNRDFALFVGLGGAGALAVSAAVVGMVIGPPGKPKPAADPAIAARAWVAPDGAGALLGGRF